LSRTFRIGERYSLKFLAEAFDIFNHANFQQTNLDNVQYTLTQDPDSGVNNSNWHADPNTDFRPPSGDGCRASAPEAPILNALQFLARPVGPFAWRASSKGAPQKLLQV